MLGGSCVNDVLWDWSRQTGHGLVGIDMAVIQLTLNVGKIVLFIS